MPELVPVSGDPFLEPVDYDPFAPETANTSPVGPAADAVTQLAQIIAQRLGRRVGTPGTVAQGVQPTVTAEMTEEDAYRLNQMDDMAAQWAPDTALGTIRK